MNKNMKKVGIVLLSIIFLILVVRVVFDQKFDDFDRYVDERENYADGPEAYDKNLEALGKWIEDYKKENPGATDEDASKAFDAAWGK